MRARAVLGEGVAIGFPDQWRNQWHPLRAPRGICEKRKGAQC